MAPASVAVPGAKRELFARHPILSHQGPMANAARPDPRYRSGRRPVEDAPEPPTATPLIARTTNKRATTADMAPAGEPPMRTTILGRRSGIHAPRNRRPSLSRAPDHSSKSERDHLSLLARHQPAGLGRHLHSRRRPRLYPHPVPVDQGGDNPVTTDSHREHARTTPCPW